MPTSTDVAKYILSKQGFMSAMKLQKLVYYSQAWSLVWDGEPLFQDRIEAWRDGPVVRELWNVHRGKFVLDAIDGGDADALGEEQRATVDQVLASYGKLDGATLSRMTHDERPWIDARGETPEGTYCENEITHHSLVAYYGAL